jgi:hypothetical protein
VKAQERLQPEEAESIRIVEELEHGWKTRHNCTVCGSVVP